jgi:hypothetical protein
MVKFVSLILNGPKKGEAYRLIVWTILTPSHFQKGGVSYDFYYIIALFVTAISVLINLFFDDFHWVEKILVSLPFAFISLFLTTLIICPIIVNLFYGDKTWFLWESNHRLFINGIFYGLNTALLTLFSHLYFNIRGKMKGGRRINESLD